MTIPSNIKRRIDRLEQASGDRRLMLVCCDLDETAEQAIAAHLADHPGDTGCEFVTVRTGVPRQTDPRH